MTVKPIVVEICDAYKSTITTEHDVCLKSPNGDKVVVKIKNDGGFQFTFDKDAKSSVEIKK